MMGSWKITFSLAMLGGILAIKILRRRRLHGVVDKKDSIMFMHRPTKQATIKNNMNTEQAADKKDIISRLPDDILVSIITHMPVEFAVRTSILSKRWRNLYKFVTDINFCCHVLWHPDFYPCNHDAGILFRMERFFRLRSSCSMVRSFHFQCRLYKSYASRFQSFISSLRSCGVEELVVYFSCCKNFPCGNFSCCGWSSDLSFSSHLLSQIPLLESFQLGACSLLPDLKSQCNSLRTLNLTCVMVLPGALECILSNCLMLQLVIINRCDCPSKLCFCGPDLQLKSLIVQDCEGVKAIELQANNLITFELRNRRPKMVKCIFDHAPQLQNVILDSYYKNIVSHVLWKLAEELPSLQSLAFYTEDDLDQGIMRFVGIKISSTFSKLRRLDLKVFCRDETDLLALTLLLECCPLLQEFNLKEFHVSDFHLDMPYDLKYDWDGAGERMQVVLHRELKKVEISGFSGTKNEVEFALYILQTALSLEKMHIIWWRFNRPKNAQRLMIEDQLQRQALCKTAHVIINCAQR